MFAISVTTLSLVAASCASADEGNRKSADRKKRMKQAGGKRAFLFFNIFIFNRSNYRGGGRGCQGRALAEWFENTQALPRRGKACSVSGFALLSLRSRNHARSAFKRFSNHSASARPYKFEALSNRLSFAQQNYNFTKNPRYLFSTKALLAYLLKKMLILKINLRRLP
jgi:hypothetical protein